MRLRTIHCPVSAAQYKAWNGLIVLVCSTVKVVPSRRSRSRASFYSSFLKASSPLVVRLALFLLLPLPWLVFAGEILLVAAFFQYTCLGAVQISELVRSHVKKTAALGWLLAGLYNVVPAGTDHCP